MRQGREFRLQASGIPSRYVPGRLVTISRERDSQGHKHANSPRDPAGFPMAWTSGGNSFHSHMSPLPTDIPPELLPGFGGNNHRNAKFTRVLEEYRFGRPPRLHCDSSCLLAIEIDDRRRTWAIYRSSICFLYTHRRTMHEHTPRPVVDGHETEPPLHETTPEGTMCKGTRERLNH